jgi:hypothetical protein
MDRNPTRTTLFQHGLQRQRIFADDDVQRTSDVNVCRMRDGRVFSPDRSVFPIAIPIALETNGYIQAEITRGG